LSSAGCAALNLFVVAPSVLAARFIAIYMAAVEKTPSKSSDAFRFVLLYDDNAIHGRYYSCVTAVGIGSAIALDELKDQLRKRGRRDT